LQKEHFLGLNDATTLSGQFFNIVDALPCHSSQQIQFINFTKISVINIKYLTQIVRHIIWENKDIKELDLVAVYLTMAA
jgi:hypothetical protein